MTDTARYLVTLDACKDPNTSWVKITTITMVSKFSEKFGISLLKSRLQRIGPMVLCKKPDNHLVESQKLFRREVIPPSEFPPEYEYNYKKPPKRKVYYGVMHPFEWTLKQNGFYNQVELGFLDQFSAKSVKVFPNGSIQVAGCSSLSDCQRILTQLKIILETLLQLKDLTSSDPKVVMINTNFSLNYSINLMETTRLFASSKEFCSVTFTPDRYSAVKIKFRPGENMKQVTVSIFSTGKTIITGAETLQEIVFAYKIITEFVNLHASSIKVEPTRITDTFDFMEGWKITEAVEYFKSIGVLPFDQPGIKLE